MKNKNKKGFTLIEVLIAITALTVAVIAPITVLSKDILGGSLTRNRITAQFLAQEAMEGVRAIRDGNLIRIGIGVRAGREGEGLPEENWFHGSVGARNEINTIPSSCVDSLSLCSFSVDDSLNLRVSTCTPGGCPTYKRDTLEEPKPDEEGFFKRVLLFDRISDDEVKMTTIVWWGKREGEDVLQSIRDDDFCAPDLSNTCVSTSTVFYKWLTTER